MITLWSKNADINKDPPIISTTSKFQPPLPLTYLYLLATTQKYIKMDEKVNIIPASEPALLKGWSAVAVER